MKRAALLFLPLTLLATEPNSATRAWWNHIVDLANDKMEGRDTGSPAYDRAAKYVADAFARNGLQPAGTNGFLQSVPLQRVQLAVRRSSARLQRKSGKIKLPLLRALTLTAAQGLPSKIDATLVFRGSDVEPPPGLDLKNAIVVRLSPPVGTPAANAPAPKLPPGALGTMGIDNLDGPERRRWPAAYAVTVSLSEALPAPSATPSFFLNPAAAEDLFQNSGHTYRELKQLYDQGKPLPWFAIPARLIANLEFDVQKVTSPNILGVLPGTDEKLKSEYVVISAHLDGYGYGSRIGDDKLYNGAFDDAAYVATLLDLAEKWKAAGVKLRRSVLFAVVTGEEKGLLGSKYFALHPTVPKESMVADINLDQLRPIFPLRILTMLALNDSTLGDIARSVAEPMGIRIQPDPEPDRNLLRRSDHWNFMQIGVPSTGFIFGYEKGSPEETTYRRWYSERYHSPTDDLTQPWDPYAAQKFNDFFRTLVEKVANDEKKPEWKAGRKPV